MPAFDVTLNPATLDGTRGKKQTLIVTATNRLGRPVTARAVPVADPPVAGAWVTAPPDAQRLFNQPNATEKFQFTFEVEAQAKPGAYTLRFDVVDVDLPDDNFGQSQVVAIHVPEVPVIVPPSPPPFKWWILVVAGVLVLGVGFAVWKLFFSAKKMPKVEALAYDDALKALDTARFVITRKDTLHSDTVTYGRNVVISQSIAAKTKLKADSNQLTLLVQQNYAAVPNLVGLLPLDAVKKLADAGLDFTQNFEAKTTHTPEEGKVVSSNPPAATMVLGNTKVTFFVRSYSEPCNDPRCIRVIDAVVLRRTWEMQRRPPD